MHQPTYDITTTIYLMLQFLFFKVFLCTEVVGKKNWSNGVLEYWIKRKQTETVTYVLTKSIRNSKFEILLPYTPDLITGKMKASVKFGHFHLYAATEDFKG